MEERITAVYVMVRDSELKPEDGGRYEGPLARQQQECFEFLKARLGEGSPMDVRVYTLRRDLLRDVERHRVGRLVVSSLDRLGSSTEEIDGMLFEFKMEGIELLVVHEG